MQREAWLVHTGDLPERRAAGLEQDLQLMKLYLAMCVHKEDWHGVMDAAADIREILAKRSMLNH